MCRQPRCILSGEVYDLTLRTKKGLPFVTTFFMKLILGSVLSRVQRDYKVTVCHHLWMGNHLHMLIVVKDAKQCTKFYGQLQKQITDAVKKLLGLKELNLWHKNRASVVRIGDVAGVRKCIAYLYANPANAHLVETIEEYPGLAHGRPLAGLKTRLRLKSLSTSSLSFYR